MDNLIIDLKIKIISLETENIALKRKMDQIYKDWNYDTNKYNELKEQFKKLKSIDKLTK
jgi:hypothetical protein